MPRPNILLLQSDEHSYRFLSARTREKGGEPCHPPTLDGLIAEGAHFESAYCQMPLCSPSRIAMLSGRPAPRAGACARALVGAAGVARLGLGICPMFRFLTFFEYNLNLIIILQIYFKFDIIDILIKIYN